MLPAGRRPDLSVLASGIKAWAKDLGFASLGIANIELAEAEARLLAWLDKKRHGEMGYMAEHGTRRSRPADLVPGTVRILSVRLPYWPNARDAESVLADPALGYLARYALGRDYHKVVRHKLQKLADQIESAVGPFGYRVFADSAPVLEKALAEKAGLGWIGKHTNLIDKDEGSWFFLGEMYTDLPLPRIPGRPTIVAPAPAASRSAPRKPSSPPMSWMPAVVSVISPLSCRVPSRSNLDH